MDPSILSDPKPDFDQRNSFLYLVLGLISASHTLIEQLGVEPSTATVSPDKEPGINLDVKTSDDLRDLLI